MQVLNIFIHENLDAGKLQFLFRWNDFQKSGFSNTLIVTLTVCSNMKHLCKVVTNNNDSQLWQLRNCEEKYDVAGNLVLEHIINWCKERSHQQFVIAAQNFCIYEDFWYFSNLSDSWWSPSCSLQWLHSFYTSLSTSSLLIYSLESCIHDTFTPADLTPLLDWVMIDAERAVNCATTRQRLRIIIHSHSISRKLLNNWRTIRVNIKHACGERWKSYFWIKVRLFAFFIFSLGLRCPSLR